MKSQRRGLLKLLGISGISLLSSCTTQIKRSPSSLLSWITSYKDPKDSLSKEGTEHLESEYDLVIIGSGYGSSVVAQELSKQYPSMNICLLERGKEFHPGDFPKKFRDIISQIRGPINKLGLLDQLLASGKESDLDIIGASGLGGTSLINAAISIRPTRQVFQQTQWPKEIRQELETDVFHELGGLEKYYKKAEARLEANDNKEQLEKTKKSQVFKKAFSKFSSKIGYLKLNIKYNSTNYELERDDCTFCGDCCSGCNVGAKNILPYNYLHRAHKNGVNIFTQCKVKSFKKIGNSYQIEVSDNSKVFPKTKTIMTSKLVLGAGSHGSTKLLLRAKLKGLSTSSKTGHSLSLNADVLGFCYNGKERTNAIGTGTSIRKKMVNPTVGTGISTYVNYREENLNKDLEDQFLLLEGAIPSPLTAIVATSLAKYAKLNKDKINFDTNQWQRVQRDDHLIPSSSKIEPEGALNYSTLFLACGHDSSKGIYKLDEDQKLKVEYDNITDERFYKLITDKMKSVSKSLGGYYLDNPRTSVFQGKMMATHPLGGCPMGDSHHDGVVNHKGQVFDERGGIHEGLYIVDASIIPRSLGATPLLTICALAHRISKYMIEDDILS